MIEVLTMDHNKKERVLWGTFNTETKLKAFLQYIMDSMNTPKDFILHDPDTNVYCNAMQYASRVYGIKKRTFAERMM